MNKLSIDSKKVSDTGQALTLLCLVIFLFTSSRIFLMVALILLVINMVCPVVRPAALVWFGLAEVLGFVVSRIVLTVVFVLLVVPVGFVRYLMGCDPFQLKKWKKSSSPDLIECQNRGGGAEYNDSIFVERKHCYTSQDIVNPY
jgi:energy-coupling factor transporter transmembrane protein EcfT